MRKEETDRWQTTEGANVCERGIPLGIACTPLLSRLTLLQFFLQKTCFENEFAIKLI